ncbi:hypothetical protein [Streptomyces sp. NPDC047000]|uniref:hypothetical protein n=1 Tax=Streptomyces sp. NPDC047000 TaxID=3155474 RepID=UPI0033F06F6A
MTDVAEEQGVRRETTRRAGHTRDAAQAGCDRDEGGPLPDWTGTDLAALRARTVHPALASVLTTLLARSLRDDGGCVAYHEDSPGVDI